MPSASRLGDIGSGHSCHFPPTPAIEGSLDVFVNGKPAFRVGDALASHGCPSCPSPAHGRAQAAGSTTVNINGQPAARIGDAISCGGTMSTGSPDVIIGDDTWSSGGEEKSLSKSFLISQMPGDARFAYRNELYKLYHNGALVQEGRTRDDGQIIYESDDLSGEFKIEAVNDTWIFKVEAFAPADTEQGAQERLDALGYNRHKEQQSTDGSDFSAATDKEGLHWFQEMNGENLKKTTTETVKNILKSFLP